MQDGAAMGRMPCQGQQAANSSREGLHRLEASRRGGAQEPAAPVIFPAMPIASATSSAVSVPLPSCRHSGAGAHQAQQSSPYTCSPKASWQGGGPQGEGQAPGARHIFPLPRRCLPRPCAATLPTPDPCLHLPRPHLPLPASCSLPASATANISPLPAPPPHPPYPASGTP